MGHRPKAAAAGNRVCRPADYVVQLCVCKTRVVRDDQLTSGLRPIGTELAGMALTAPGRSRVLLLVGMVRTILYWASVVVLVATRTDTIRRASTSVLSRTDPSAGSKTASIVLGLSIGAVGHALRADFRVTRLGLVLWYAFPRLRRLLRPARRGAFSNDGPTSSSLVLDSLTRSRTAGHDRQESHGDCGGPSASGRYNTAVVGK